MYHPKPQVSIDTLTEVARLAAETAVKENGVVHPEDIVAQMVAALDSAAATLMTLHRFGELK